MIQYDLKCRNCGKEFMIRTSFSKLKDATCPHCESTNHKRVYKANITGPVRTSQGNAIPPTSGFT